MNIFLTGATGFIGSNFLKAALAAGHAVVALRRSGSYPVIPIPETDRLIWVDGELTTFLDGRDLEVLQISDVSSSVFVHLAAAGVNQEHASWEVCFETNVHQSLGLWRRAASLGIRKIVLCGSCFEYGLSGESYEFIPPTAPLMPTGPYHASKAAATMAAIALAVYEKIELAVLRPFHVFGEGEGLYRFWPTLRKAALAGDDFPMTLGEQVRDFVPVETVAEFFLREIQSMVGDSQTISPSTPSGINTHNRSQSFRIVNVGTGHPQSLREFAQHWWKHWNAKGKILFGAIPYRPNEVMRYVPQIYDYQ